MVSDFFRPEVTEEMLFQASLVMGEWEYAKGRGGLTTATMGLGEGWVLERPHLAGGQQGQWEAKSWGSTMLYRGGYRASKSGLSQACPVLGRCRYFPVYCPGSMEWHWDRSAGWSLTYFISSVWWQFAVTQDDSYRIIPVASLPWSLGWLQKVRLVHFHSKALTRKLFKRAGKTGFGNTWKLGRCCFRCDVADPEPWLLDHSTGKCLNGCVLLTYRTPCSGSVAEDPAWAWVSQIVMF